MRVAAGLKVRREPAEGMPWWADAALPGLLRPVPPGDLPAGYAWGYRSRQPLTDMTVHLGYLERRLRSAGGLVERRQVASLAEAAEAAPVVVNCTGIGARDLVPDPSVRPVRGQLVVVENPGVDEWFIEDVPGHSESTYFFPHPGAVVLGGTVQEDAWDLAPDPAVAEAIVRRCARVDPRLGRARVLGHRVGLRPARPRVRLDSETLPGGALCVHNYGHGGAGVTLAWACAEDAAALAET